MGALESALESWDFILFDERTFRFIRTHRNNSSPHLTHTQDFQIWARITKIKVGNKIMRVNDVKLNLEEIWSCSIQKIIKNSSWRTPRQHFECQNEKIHKQKSENDENWYCDKRAMPGPHIFSFVGTQDQILLFCKPFRWYQKNKAEYASYSMLLQKSRLQKFRHPIEKWKCLKRLSMFGAMYGIQNCLKKMIIDFMLIHSKSAILNSL